MREIVTLHFGQAGVQLGNANWELLTLEHGINERGILKEEPRGIECLETFFTLSQKGSFVPRAIFIDLESSIIDEIRASSFRNLFHPDKLISGPEDAAGNFARGFFTVGKLIINKVCYELRKIMESCDNVHGIIIFRGLGGGTGSGLTSAILDNFAEYPKTCKLEFPVYPSPMLSTSTVEPYNSLLAQHFCMEDIDIGLLFDNEAVYDVCTGNLRKHSATYVMLNRLIAQVCSNLTVSIRFENTICSDFSALQCNIVPFPRIHFPVCNYAPIMSEEQVEHSHMTISELTSAAFSSDTQLMKVDFSFGKIMSSALSYRGNVSPYHVYSSLIEIKNKKEIEFVDWCPTGFRVGINLCPPIVVPNGLLAPTEKNVTLLTNTSAMGQAWQKLTFKFYMLFSKRSFIHWYVGEGMEECEFTEALNNISSLVKDYEECVLDSKRENKNYSSPNKLKNNKSTKPDHNNEIENSDCIKFSVETMKSPEQNYDQLQSNEIINNEKESTKGITSTKQYFNAVPLKCTDEIETDDCVTFSVETIENIEQDNSNNPLRFQKPFGKKQRREPKIKHLKKFDRECKKNEI